MWHLIAGVALDCIDWSFDRYQIINFRLSLPTDTSLKLVLWFMRKIITFHSGYMQTGTLANSEDPDETALICFLSTSMLLVSLL